MSERTHLEILKQGAEAWDNWRLEYPGVKPQLSGEDLSELDLSRADLTDMSYGTYRTMKGHFYGIRGLSSCYGNAFFVRDAQDQDYLDTIENRIEATPSAGYKRWKRFWFRDECLNQHWFVALHDARHEIENWRQDYNRGRRLRERPKSPRHAARPAVRQGAWAGATIRMIWIAKGGQH